MAINSPLLDNVSIKGARGILVNISGSKSLSLQQVSKAATIVNKEAGPGVHVFLGAVIDDELEADELAVAIEGGEAHGPGSGHRPPHVGDGEAALPHAPELLGEGVEPALLIKILDSAQWLWMPYRRLKVQTKNARMRSPASA